MVFNFRVLDFLTKLLNCRNAIIFLCNLINRAEFIETQQNDHSTICYQHFKATILVSFLDTLFHCSKKPWQINFYQLTSLVFNVIIFRFIAEVLLNAVWQVLTKKVKVKLLLHHNLFFLSLIIFRFSIKVLD